MSRSPLSRGSGGGRPTYREALLSPARTKLRPPAGADAGDARLTAHFWAVAPQVAAGRGLAVGKRAA